MPLHPNAQAVLQAMTQGFAPDFSQMSVADYRAMLAQMPPLPPGDALAAVEDHRIESPGGALAVRVYHPSRAPGLPATVFLHGGGFVSLGLDSHDNLCRRIARLSGSVVIAVDYRLAPEARFPAAVEDACAALRWVQREAALLGIDARRLAVAGDSAGGNLAAAAARHLKDDGVGLRHQLLFYPALDPGCDSPSFREFGSAGYVLTTTMMRWFWDHYLPGPAAAHDPRAAPLVAPEYDGLPAATVIVAECDPLRDEGEAYAQRLAAAGVPVRTLRVPGVFHGFASLLGFLEQADQAVAAGAQALRESFQEGA